MDFQIFSIKALQLICCLSLLVLLHELGHFGFSKLFKVKVEKFYLFFNPRFHLFSTRDKWFTRRFPYFKDNETEYGIGWLPLGGYVKIAGMIDESMDLEQMSQPAKPWEFRSQRVWKRFFIMVGGVLMNLLTAWAIYSAVLFTWGHDYVPIRSLQHGLEFNSSARELGFRNGDIPIAADGDSIVEYSIQNFRMLCNASQVTVLRQGQELNIEMPHEGLNLIEVMEMQPPLMQPAAPIVVDSVLPGTAAARIGLKPGARIVAVDGKAMTTWGDFDEKVFLPRRNVLQSPKCRQSDSLKLRLMEVVFVNPGEEQITALAKLNDDYLLGVIRAQPALPVVHQQYDILECIPAGFRFGWNTLSGYVNDLKYIPSKKGAQSVGSFMTIGSIFPAVWDWGRFWTLTAFVSIILAVMNVLPIPGLDGGHIMILAYEAITGRTPSDRAMDWLERIGLGLIFCLMLLGFGNDIVRFVLPFFGL